MFSSSSYGRIELILKIRLNFNCIGKTKWNCNESKELVSVWAAHMGQGRSVERKGGNIKNDKYEERHKTDKWVDDSWKQEKRAKEE